MSREGDSRMSAYTPDQLAVHEYIARKRGTPVSHEHRYEPQEEPRHHHRKEEKKKKKVQLLEPEYNGAPVDDEVFSFEKVKTSFHVQINCGFSELLLVAVRVFHDSRLIRRIKQKNYKKPRDLKRDSPRSLT